MRTFLQTFLAVLLLTQGITGQNLNWARQTGGILGDNTIGMTVDNELNIYAVTNFLGNITLTTGQNFSSFGKEDFLVKKFSPSGTLLWSRKFGSKESDFAHNITSDNQSNTYITGTFQDTLRLFDQVVLISTVNSVNVGFIIKLSPGGDFLWARALQSTVNSFPVKAKALTNGEVIIAGNFEGVTDFDPGAGQQVLTSNGLTDIFFLKLSAEGNFIWVRKVGGTESESLQDFELDNAGNIISVGQFNQVVDFDPGAGQAFTVHNGGSDIFVHKLASNGEFVWVQAAGGAGFDAGLGVDVAPNQDIVIVGRFSNTVDFNPEISQNFTLISEGSWDGFVWRLTANGQFVWAKKIGGTQNDQCVSVDISVNDVIAVGGVFRSTVNFNPDLFPNQFATANGGADIFHLLLNKNGSYNSHFILGGIGNEHLNKILLYSINNILSIGNFVNIVDFDPSQISSNFTSVGNTDGFIANIFNCIRPYIPQIVSTDNFVCRNDMFTISLPSAQLNGANQWSWYQGSCNTTSFATGNSITGSVIQSTVFYVRGTGGCAQNTECRDIIINAFTDTLTNQSITICQGASVTVGSKVYNTTGLYLDTLVASVGCDSVVFTNLLVLPPSTKEQAFTICPGDEVIVGTKIYRSNGIYIDTLSNTGGCDSVITTAITVIPVEIVTQNINLCQGESYVVEDSVYTRTGIYVNSFITPDGCENFIITNLTVYPLEYDITHDLCFGDTLRIGNQFYTNSIIVVEFLGSSIGCDSIVNHTINFYNNSFENRQVFLCGGDSLVVGNNVYKESGLYIDSLVNIAGCDSIIQSNVVFFDKPADTNLSFTICEGQSVLVNGETYFSPGTFMDTIQTEFGCDSVIIIQLQVFPTFTQNFITICQGDSIAFGNEFIKKQGIYSKTFVSSIGCDSTSSIIVTVINNITEFQQVKICEGDSYMVGTSVYDKQGIYLDTLLSSRGCDSIIQTTLLVLPLVYQQNISICQGGQVQVGESIYSTTGIYTDSLQSSFGCDSIVITNLKVNQKDFRAQNFTICSGKSIQVGNTNYTKSGVYTNVFKNQFGCDSIVETTLTVTSPPSIEIDKTICQGETYKIGNFSFTMPGQFELFLSSPGQCDTLVKLKLSVLLANTSITRIVDTLIAVPQENVIYEWYSCNPGLPRMLVGTGQKFIPPANGNYILRIRNAHCIFESDCFAYVKTSSDDGNEITFVVYPNPAQDGMYVEYDLGGTTDFEIFHTTGQKVMNGTLMDSKNFIDLSSIHQPGIYLLNLVNSGKNQTIFFIKK